MAFAKITDSDLKGKGNVGRPDTPGVTTAEMQRILDEIPREVIVPAFNALVDALNSGTAAGSFGATFPVELPGGETGTIQDVLNALAKQASEHISDRNNPHKLTAEKIVAAVPTELPQDTEKTVQAVLDASAAYMRSHKQDKQNPHDVTAAQVGAVVPQGLPGDTQKTMQSVSDALMHYIQAHEKTTDNPHRVTAQQLGAYTKTETDNKIRTAVDNAAMGNVPALTDEDIVQILNAI